MFWRHFLRKANFKFSAAWISGKSYGNFGIGLYILLSELGLAWISGDFVEILPCSTVIAVSLKRCRSRLGNATDLLAVSQSPKHCDDQISERCRNRSKQSDRIQNPYRYCYCSFYVCTNTGF